MGFPYWYYGSAKFQNIITVCCFIKNIMYRRPLLLSLMTLVAINDRNKSITCVQTMTHCNYATWTSWCHKSLANRVCSASCVIENKIKITKSPVTGVFLKQRASNVESMPISWLHHIMRWGCRLYKLFDTIAKATPILCISLFEVFNYWTTTAGHCVRGGDENTCCLRWQHVMVAFGRQRRDSVCNIKKRSMTG